MERNLKKIAKSPIVIVGNALGLIGNIIDLGFRLMWSFRQLCLKGILSLMKLMNISCLDHMIQWGERPFERKEKPNETEENE